MVRVARRLRSRIQAPRELAPALRALVAPAVAEGRVCLGIRTRVLFHARSVAHGDFGGLVDPPEGLVVEVPVPGTQEHARTVARPDEGVCRPGRAMHEVPGTEVTFLILVISTHSPARTRKSSSTDSAWYMPLDRPGWSTRRANPAPGLTYSVRSGRPLSTKSSDSKMQQASVASLFSQTPSRALSTNHPAVTGVRPDPPARAVLPRSLESPTSRRAPRVRAPAIDDRWMNSTLGRFCRT